MGQYLFLFKIKIENYNPSSPIYHSITFFIWVILLFFNNFFSITNVLFKIVIYTSHKEYETLYQVNIHLCCTIQSIALLTNLYKWSFVFSHVFCIYGIFYLLSSKCNVYYFIFFLSISIYFFYLLSIVPIELGALPLKNPIPMNIAIFPIYKI